MKKELKTVDKKAGIMRVTTVDERWYAFPSIEKKTGLPIYEYIPSVTWICSHYPKGIGFYKWLANTGWDEAEAIKTSAGDKGSKVHNAVELLIAGNTLHIDDRLPNPSTGELEEFSLEEWEAIMSFTDWVKEVNPTFLLKESLVHSKKYGYAGTVDCVATIDGEDYIIDFKTSQSVWAEFELQLSAYKQALVEMDKVKPDVKLAVLQLGYRKNRVKYKFTEVNEQFPLFLSAMNIWKKETEGQEVKQKDYPLEITL